MQKVIKLWFAFTLSAGLLASCSQDGREPSSATDGGGETVTLSLSAEVSVEDPSLRAINYKLGKNSKDQLVPMPQFADKQEVEVHTIIKSNTGARVAKTLKWVYDAEKRKLVLAPMNRDISLDENNMVVSGFNNNGGVKWYISGLIGGELVPGTTRVTFAGERVLKGVVGNEGDIVGSLNVPYSFGWTELSINTTDTRDSNGSHKYAKVPEESEVKFVPRGSLIAYKLGNAQTAGSYSFTAQGFSVGSNAWGDQGEFELNTNIPSAEPHKQQPTWTESSCGSSMYYTFATGHAPSTISANGTADKIYYAWVMSHSTQPAAAEVRVMLKGESSRQATATYRDYTKTWFTDYSPKSTGTQGKVTQGQVHSLTAKATRRVTIPIEYVTDYNLAGGEGLTAIPNVNPQHPGVIGALRFTTSHRTDHSGYYNLYKVLGRYEATANPQTKNLQTEVDATFGADKYFIPNDEQFWGIFLSPGSIDSKNWDDTYNYDPIFGPQPNEHFNVTDIMRVGFGEDAFRQAYLSDYSSSFTSPHGGNNETDNAVFYAIRFKARSSNCSAVQYGWRNRNPRIYPSALDNSMRCAYRFTRIGGAISWAQYNGAGHYYNQNFSNQLRIDVVYLGEESSPTELATISDEAWWAEKSSRGEVISKTFPAAGWTGGDASNPGSLMNRGQVFTCWSSSYVDDPGLLGFSVWATGNAMTVSGIPGAHVALPIRLFSTTP